MPRIFLYHSSWGQHLPPPIAGIGLEWARKPLFDTAYSGIWHNWKGELRSRAEERHPRLLDALRDRLPPGSGKNARPPA